MSSIGCLHAFCEGIDACPRIGFCAGLVAHLGSQRAQAVEDATKEERGDAGALPVVFRNRTAAVDAHATTSPASLLLR